MRYMHKKICFNKFELQELERRNPTLFDLAKYVADKAHIVAEVNGDNWVTVYSKDKYGKGQLLCPFEVFYTKDTEECSDLKCWSMRGETYKTDDGVKVIRPCWFRTWNDFVNNQKVETK